MPKRDVAPLRPVQAVEYLRRLADDLDGMLRGTEEFEGPYVDAITEGAEALRALVQKRRGGFLSGGGESLASRLRRAERLCRVALSLREGRGGATEAGEWLAHRLVLEDVAFFTCVSHNKDLLPATVKLALKGNVSSPRGVLAQLVVDTGAYGYPGGDVQHARRWIRDATR